jgi:hypothetical protein
LGEGAIAVKNFRDEGADASEQITGSGGHHAILECVEDVGTLTVAAVCRCSPSVPATIWLSPS